MIRTRIDKSQRWLIIKIPLQTPKASKSGNLVIASSRGVKADEASINGKPIYAVANAWIYPDSPKPKTATAGAFGAVNGKEVSPALRKNRSASHPEERTKRA